MVAAPAALRVDVEAGGRRRVRHRIVGGSFLSESDPRFHFGLGDAARVASLTVVDSGGGRARYLGLPAGRLLVLPAR